MTATAKSAAWTSVGMPRCYVHRTAHGAVQEARCFMESAEVAWTCSCGIKVKVGLDMTRPYVTVQCPNPSCNAKRTLAGQIVRLLVQNKQDAVWRSVDVNGLVYPSH